MGFWRKTFGLTQAVRDLESAPTFAGEGTVEADSGVLYGTLDDYIFKTGRITRAEALRVPAVKKARDLICGTIGQWTLGVLDPDGRPATSFTPNLFQQPEPGVAPSVTWTRVVEDMLLHERAWFKTLNVGWHGRPVDGVRLDAETVTIQPQYRHFPEGTAKVWPDRPGLIRIDSPNEGLLNGSPAIRACIALERAALNHLDGTPPLDYFTPGEGDDVDALDEDEIKDALDAWAEARRTRSTGYVPAALKYNIAGWDPEKLQLAEARLFAIGEVSRLTGLDPEDLGVSTTSRTYFNGQDRRRVRIEDVLGPYMKAIEARLSMDDVTPHGYTVAFDTSSYLRLDDLSAAQADSVLIAAKVLTRDEARAKRGLEPLGGVDNTDPVDPAEVNNALSANAAIAAAARNAQIGPRS